MPTLHLTDIAVKHLKAPDTGQVTYWDDGLPGFGLRVSQGGAKSFTLVHGEKRERTTIGRYPVISLADARSTAKTLLAQRTLTKHRPPAISFSKAVDLFITTHCNQRNRPSTKRETERLLRSHFIPYLGSKNLEDIITASVAKIVDGLLDRPSEANHAFTAVRTFFRWSIRRGYLRHSPCEAMQRPSKPNTRDRVLTARELQTIWKAAEDYGYPFGTIVQLLLLTGQRRNEVSALRWEYIDEKTRTITLPAALTKNHRGHTFPYGDMVQCILNPIASKEGYLFPARGTNEERSFNGWSKSFASFSGSLERVQPFTLHDLRRTFATNLAHLGVAPHIVERLLNHSSGTISGVAAIYNRFNYMDEMRDAIRLYERHLASLINGRNT